MYFLECTVVQCKDALSIYWNRHGHECSRIKKLSANFTLIQCIKIVSRFFGPRYIRDDFFRVEIYRGRLLTLITGSSSRLLRIRFSADLTMYWFPVYYFRCMKFKPLVIWIWNQNIAISTIVGTWSQITLLLPKVSIIQIQSKLPLLLRSMHRGLNRFHRHRGHAAYILLYIRVL